ncbi:Hypothetical protein ADU71_0899 [Pediococcus damnosus]|uniref:Uncharacterized protein n=1 Tax=Pediococcus damnosus TaxID=51663 RepID=A0AAC9B2P7_9LACO|nr:Hypothetical protein ADU69_0823 [Pediococcus damnosus]AMV63046.1 Hypothetical protein ADU70_1564 [Pediococcus damnosus]AMV64803.1 Hypothetical protein ADU71_0899 [Pediococcus damnosus]
MIPNDLKYSKDFIKVKRAFVEIKTNVNPIKNYVSFRSKNLCEKHLWTTVDNFVNNSNGKF